MSSSETPLTLSAPQAETETGLRPYELFIVLLCCFSLLMLGLETFIHLPAEDAEIIDAVDNVICGIFFIDFLVRFVAAPNKLKFMVWGWVDLVSSIPVLDALRLGRVVRIFRILRVLRGFRLARIMSVYLQHHRADGTLLTVILSSILLLLLSSIAILQVEQVDGANIKTPSDALWWSIATMTTVGYGDKYPTTSIGRMISSIVMVCGVGMFGMLSGSVTSWILQPARARRDINFATIQSELVVIQSRLDAIQAKTSANTDPRLTRIMASWPELSEATRKELLRIAER
ncbi:ion transporter [Schlesneria sp.]|uniref:ion transporter n=1 Tax=Schlesneria sp. TaxID=2762018 RepID=UPI002F1803CB